MARSLIYLVSRDADFVSRVLATEGFVVKTFDTVAALLAARRSPDMTLIDFDQDLTLEGLPLVLGVATSIENIPQDAVISFIPKSASMAVLTDWLLQQERLCEESSAMKLQVSEGFRVAMTAMQANGETGLVLRFLAQAFEVKDVPELMNRALGVLAEYGLSGAVQVRMAGRTFDTASDESDVQVFSQMRHLGRILEFKQRMIINYDRVSILVKNMPGDIEFAGRLRDHLATLAEGLDSRVVSLMLEMANRDMQAGIQVAGLEIQGVLDEFVISGSRQMNEAYLEVERQLIGLGLTSGQEADLFEAMDRIRQSVPDPHRLTSAIATLSQVAVAKVVV